MLHLLYILAFTILACIAVANLIRNLIMFSFDRERNYPAKSSAMGNQGYLSSKKQVPHPELLDSAGNIIKEPLLVMRSINVEDARQQLDDEFLSVVDLILSVFKSLQLQNFKARLSFRDPASDKYIGSDEAWEKAQGAIRRAVEQLGMDHFEGIGEAAFYGPKLDFIFQDALEREWQLGTVQVDYNLPERFDLEYVAEDGSRKRPVMIHRAPFGSLERLIGILIEEYAGDFPLWLAPVQIRLLSVSDAQLDFAKDVVAKMQALGIRAEVDTSGDRLGKLIRNAEKDKIPVMAVVGAKEVETNSLSIRTRASGELGAISVDEVVQKLKNAIVNFDNF